MSQRRCAVRLMPTAEADFNEIVQWTINEFGERQALIYAETLSLAFEALSDWPDGAGARARDDIHKGLFSLHIARAGRKGRHFVLFRVRGRGAGQAIEVLRLLHDSMELSRHIESLQ